jgi:integrase
LGAHGGFRAADMAALEFKHVDLGSRILSIKSGKGGKDRTVMISESLTQAFSDYVPKKVAPTIETSSSDQTTKSAVLKLRV